MQNAIENIVIIGAGQAGYSVAARLRKEKYDGSITMLGEEPEPPYQRPPLSKAYLMGKLARQRLYLRKQEYYQQNEINLCTDTRVISIDRQRKQVESTKGSHTYDALIIATGSKPKQLPQKLGGRLPNVATIRSIADIDKLAATLGTARQLLIVGGGYIGLEAAAVARQIGLEVTLVEASERILVRVASTETADFFRTVHQQQGVKIHEDCRLESLQQQGDSLEATLCNGDLLKVDAVIVGIGADPDVSFAADCGLETDKFNGGIKVNEFGQTSDASIWAAGDCTSFMLDGQSIRLESVQNAVDQADNVALNLLGRNQPYQPVPWFWSDQFGFKLQIAGFSQGHHRVVVRRGPKENALSHWYFDGERLLGVDAINDAGAYMTARRLLESGRAEGTLSDNTLADPEFDLKSLLG